jgi:vanillate O-demethylase monooxygenase subunit
MSFLKDHWYVAASAAELGAAPLGRMVAGEPLVLFRRTDGRVAALEDRCPHRKYMLSKGAVVGDELQCGYHGVQFDGSGACTKIPSQRAIPRGFGAHAYAAIEKYALIFVWLGDAATADPALLPDWSANTAPGWIAVHGYLHVAANYQLLVDNLLDLTHVPIVHKTILSAAGALDAPLTVEADEKSVRAHRFTSNVEPNQLQRATMGITGRIDRDQEMSFVPPCYVNVTVRANPTGSNDRTPQHIILNSLVPETERSTHYFWSVVRCFALDNAEISAKLRAGAAEAFDEDALVVAEQQRMLESGGAQLLSTLDGDKAATAARRIVARKLKEQKDSVRASTSPARTV